MGVIAVSALCSAPALALGTLAGTTITNEVTVSYEVSGITQADEEASDDILVDRKIDLIVSRVDDNPTQVTPGEDLVAVVFEVENLSNDTLDFDLSAAQVTTGNPAGISGNDAFDVDTPLEFYLDDGGTPGIYDGTNTSITHLNALAPDTPITVLVVSPLVPTGLDTDDIAAVVLTAEGREDDGAGTLGLALAESGSNDPGLVDTVFADAAGDTDAANDAMHSATDDFIIYTASITATKTSEIVAGGFAIDASIPGATIQYCITVSNASGGAAASNIVISDSLPAEVTYDSGFGILVGGTDCSDLVTDNGSGNFTDPVVSGTIANLPAGDSQTLIFRAEID